MDPKPYARPTLTRLGTFRDLTRAGCTGQSDGATFYASGTAVATGDTPRVTSGTIDYCFSARGSR